MRYWHKDRDIGHWNRIENPEMNLTYMARWFFNKYAKTVQWRKDTLQEMVKEELLAHMQNDDAGLLLYTTNVKKLIKNQT